MSDRPLSIYILLLLQKGVNVAPNVGPNLFGLSKDLNKFYKGSYCYLITDIIILRTKVIESCEATIQGNNSTTNGELRKIEDRAYLKGVHILEELYFPGDHNITLFLEIEGRLANYIYGTKK